MNSLANAFLFFSFLIIALIKQKTKKSSNGLSIKLSHGIVQSVYTKNATFIR